MLGSRILVWVWVGIRVRARLQIRDRGGIRLKRRVGNRVGLKDDHGPMGWSRPSAHLGDIGAIAATGIAIG